MLHDINEKGNKIRDLNNPLEILSEVSKLKLNDINNQITTILVALNNTTSSHKAKSNCSSINSNQDIDEIKFFMADLKNKNTIINILLGNIFSNNMDFSSYKNLQDNHENNVEEDQFDQKETQLKIEIKIRTMKQF